MSVFTRRFSEGFGTQYTTEEKVKTVVRAVVGVVPLVLYSVMTSKFIRRTFHSITMREADTIRVLSIITALIFLLWLVFNTIADQITPTVRKGGKKNAHRLTHLAIFSIVVLLFKIIVFLIIHHTGPGFAGLLPEFIEIALFALMLYLCNMKRG